jgi:hypothetical protein
VRRRREAQHTSGRDPSRRPQLRKRQRLVRRDRADRADRPRPSFPARPRALPTATAPSPRRHHRNRYGEPACSRPHSTDPDTA